MASLRGVMACGLALVLAAANAAAQEHASAPRPGAGAEMDETSVLRAQILLERTHFSPGEIDGRNGSNTRMAIIGYQRSKGLRPTGQLDAPTWASLNSDSAPMLMQYTITADDLAGPFVEVPDDMMAKAELKTLGYGSALEALAERFRSSPRLLRQLNPGVNFQMTGASIAVPRVNVAAPAPAAKVIVDRSDSTVALADASGKIYAQYPATTGSEHDPLPIGAWTITGVAKDPPFHYNPELFWDADPTHAKAKIASGPNNPVGLVWIDLSKEHYGIHGTPEPSRIGKTQSHGCIRLTNWSALEVAQAVTAGTPALLQE